MCDEKIKSPQPYSTPLTALNQQNKTRKKIRFNGKTQNQRITINYKEKVSNRS